MCSPRFHSHWVYLREILKALWNVYFIWFIYFVHGTKPRALDMASKCSTTELDPWPSLCLFIHSFIHSFVVFEVLHVLGKHSTMELHPQSFQNLRQVLAFLSYPGWPSPCYSPASASSIAGITAMQCPSWNTLSCVKFFVKNSLIFSNHLKNISDWCGLFTETWDFDISVM